MKNTDFDKNLNKIDEDIQDIKDSTKENTNKINFDAKSDKEDKEDIEAKVMKNEDTIKLPFFGEMKKSILKMSLVGVVVLALIFIVISLIGSKGNKKAKVDNDQTQKVTIDDTKLEGHKDFLDSLESDKDVMIQTAKAQLNAVENKQALSRESKSDFYLEMYQQSTAHAELIETILSDAIAIQDSYSEKDLEITRKRIARYFDDELSKATYHLVEGGSPSKDLGIDTAIVGDPIIANIYDNDGSGESSEIVAVLIAAKDETKHTAFYQANWSSAGKLKDLKFLGMIDGFNIELSK